MRQKINYRSIGVVHSPLKEPRDAPIQPAGAGDLEATVEVFPEYAEGLADLEGFSHIILIYHFHLTQAHPLRVVPFLDTEERGVFATRAPARPNPIGMSIVRLVSVEGRELRVREVDILDGTPLLDIKPYVPAFDFRSVEKIGWLSGRLDKLPGTRDDGRFSG
jgi:tRNA-Thr(GGU) m(6)t(6)A37 methyltransferase TsaA